MSLDELDDIYYNYYNLAEKRENYLDSMVGFLNKLKQERGYIIEDIKKCDNYVSLKFMDYNIRIQHEIILTKPNGRIKWLNIKFDSNNKIETDCILDYPIDSNGVIKDGEQVYNLSLKVNSFLINSMLHFLKECEK